MILCTVRRYLNITPAEWDSLGWDYQQMYLDHLDQDEEIPFRIETSQPNEPAGADGPATRENVDIGASVLDLNAMRADLEEARRRRRGGLS